MTRFDPTSPRQRWETPREMAETIVAEYRITVDACASDCNAIVPRYWSIDRDALSFDWPREERIFFNPPFGAAKEFALQAAKHASPNSTNVALLLDQGAQWREDFLRSSTGWWRFDGRVDYQPPPDATAEEIKNGKPYFGSLLVEHGGKGRPQCLGWRCRKTGKILETTR